ncbi:MAG: hypothetical protein KJP05_02055, partial [Deltaproteobacteria bacterium]|nr:hypothetical protein [Deltaproteobacteria bacterium]
HKAAGKLRNVRCPKHFIVVRSLAQQQAAGDALAGAFSMTKTKNRFGISNFGHCDLFDICDLCFGISDTLMSWHSKTSRHVYRQSH